MSRYLLIITLFAFTKVFASGPMTSKEFIDHLTSKNKSGKKMIAAEQAAFDIYNNYKDNFFFKVNPQRLVGHTAKVYNFFKARVGTAEVLPPDRQASLHIFLNSNPRFTPTSSLTSDADLVAKAYNTNECQRVSSNNCDLLTENELVNLKRIDENLKIKSFFKNAKNQVVSDFQALSSGIVSRVQSLSKPTQKPTQRPVARPTHVINCEVSPPNYNRCVTVDGIVYVRQSSQPISDIETHLRKASPQRNTINRNRDASN